MTAESLRRATVFLRAHVGLLLAWNLPLLMAILGYYLGYCKLIGMQYTGLVIAKWDEETEAAIRLIIWSYHNPWLFPVSAIVSNLVLILTRSGGRLLYVRWSVFATLAALGLGYASLGFHLDGKLLGMP